MNRKSQQLGMRRAAEREGGGFLRWQVAECGNCAR